MIKEKVIISFDGEKEDVRNVVEQLCEHFDKDNIKYVKNSSNVKIYKQDLNCEKVLYLIHEIIFNKFDDIKYYYVSIDKKLNIEMMRGQSKGDKCFSFAKTEEEVNGYLFDNCIEYRQYVLKKQYSLKNKLSDNERQRTEKELSHLESNMKRCIWNMLKEFPAKVEYIEGYIDFNPRPGKLNDNTDKRFIRKED